MGIPKQIWAVATCALLCACAMAIASQPVDRLDRRELTLTFSDDFNRLAWDDPGTAFVGGPWRTWYRNDSDPYNLHNRTLPGNRELQVYGDPTYFARLSPDKELPATTGTRNGKLILRAFEAPEDVRPKIWGRQYLSGMISNWGAFEQLYGVFEMRAKLPAGKGMWPAFWLMPTDGSWPPEIDIFEVLGDKIGELNVGYHTAQNGKETFGKHNAIATADLSAGFHNYALDWSRERMIFYLDDVEVARWPTPPEINKPMYMIINLAVGGKWPGAPDKSVHFPRTMEVDWIRVYRRDRIAS